MIATYKGSYKIKHNNKNAKYTIYNTKRTTYDTKHRLYNRKHRIFNTNYKTTAQNLKRVHLSNIQQKVKNTYLTCKVYRIQYKTLKKATQNMKIQKKKKKHSQYNTEQKKY